MVLPRLSLLLAFLLAAPHAEDEVELLISPDNRHRVNDALITPLGVGLMVGTEGSVYRSRDSGATWTSMPRAAYHELKSLCASDPRTVFAVGMAGAIQRSTDAGETWRRLDAGISNHLRDVHFPDPLTGFVAGDEGTLLKTADGGNTWRSLTTGIAMRLEAVHFPDPLHGFAAGYRDTLLRTSDGGATWSAQPVTFEGLVKDSTNRLSILYFRQVHFFDARNGFLVGQNSLGYGSGKHVSWFNFPLLLETRDGGLTWSKRPVASLGSVQWMEGGRAIAHIYDTLRVTLDQGATWTAVPTDTFSNPVLLGFSNPQAGFIADPDGRVTLTRDGGRTWTRLAKSLVPIQDHGHFNSVHFPTPDLGHIAGGSGMHGSLHRSTDGGATWRAHPLSFPVALLAVHFPRPLVGVAVGGATDSLGRDRGMLLHTTDGGITWKDKSEATETTLRAVHFPTARTGFAVGNQGVVRVTGDSGHTWTSLESGTVVDLHSVHFLDENTGFIGGSRPDRSGEGRLMRTSDGGKTWLPIDLGVFSGPILSIAFPSHEVGYLIQDGGALLKTTDGGVTWKSLGPATDMSNLLFFHADTGYMVGKSIMKTVDGGARWSEVAGGWYGNGKKSSSPAAAGTFFAVGPGTVVRVRNFQPTPIAIRSLPGRGRALQVLPGGRFRFDLLRSSQVTASILDLKGRTREKLLDRILPAGRHELALPRSPCGGSPCILDFRSGGLRQALPLR